MYTKKMLLMQHYREQYDRLESQIKHVQAESSQIEAEINQRQTDTDVIIAEINQLKQERQSLKDDMVSVLCRVSVTGKSRLKVLFTL